MKYFNGLKRSLLVGVLITAVLASSDSGAIPRDPVPTPQDSLMNEETHEAIKRGLDFLASRQGKDGFWRTPSCPIVMSCMSGIALASVEPSRGGPYWENLERLIDGVLEIQTESGYFRRANEGDRPSYGHAFSVILLSQLYGMMDPEMNERMSEALKDGVDYIIRKQARDGSWYQNYVSGHNQLVTVYHVLALRAAMRCGIIVPRATIEKAIKFINNFGRNFGTPSRTACSVATILLAGDYGNRNLASMMKQMKSGLNYNLTSLQWPIFHHMNAALVMYFYGGKEWEDYYRKIRKSCLKLQKKDGSWGPYRNVHWLQPDAVYTTANICMILQMPVESLPYWQYVKSDYRVWKGKK